jgi:cytoskeletal protein CcmA (bactofilin family)
MWKREGMPDPAVPSQPDVAPVPERPAAPRVSRDVATIGRSITIRGEVTGDEDLLIQGRVDGSVNLRQHSVTVGPEGEVKGDIVGRVVTVEGSVEGNLLADEQVILKRSSLVQGDIAAPRVVLEDGAHFRGGVDMGDAGGRAAQAANAQRAKIKRPADTGVAGPAAPPERSPQIEMGATPVEEKRVMDKGAVPTAAQAR